MCRWFLFYLISRTNRRQWYSLKSLWLDYWQCSFKSVCFLMCWRITFSQLTFASTTYSKTRDLYKLHNVVNSSTVSFNISTCKLRYYFTLLQYGDYSSCLITVNNVFLASHRVWCISALVPTARTLSPKFWIGIGILNRTHQSIHVRNLPGYLIRTFKRKWLKFKKRLLPRCSCIHHF